MIVTAAASAGAATVTSPILGADEAFAATPYAGSYPDTKILGPSARHLVLRFSYGLTPGLVQTVLSLGPKTWFEQQLTPERIPDAAADRLADWWPDLARDPQDLWQRHTSGKRPSWKVACDYQRWVLARRTDSNRQLLEVMTEFWENHLHVPSLSDPWFTWRADYGRLIRSLALGTFTYLLTAAITHPAMLTYLDNADSTKQHPNENLGRELLELHTVGRIYSESDVKNSARILTGHQVDLRNTWQPHYAPEAHSRGPVRVLGFHDENASADGRAVTTAYLRYLARHPATARRIATKLAVKFVRDDPPQSLIDNLTKTYLDHDTAIVPVLRALVASAAFRDSAGAKVRTPSEDVVATYRAMQVRLTKPGSPDDGSGANVRLWQVFSMGESPLGWPRPDGPPIDGASWSSP